MSIFQVHFIPVVILLTKVTESFIHLVTVNMEAVCFYYLTVNYSLYSTSTVNKISLNGKWIQQTKRNTIIIIII